MITELRGFAHAAYVDCHHSVGRIALALNKVAVGAREAVKVILEQLPTVHNAAGRTVLNAGGGATIGGDEVGGGELPPRCNRRP